MIRTDLNNEQYHATEAVSKSTLDLIHVAPALVEWRKTAPVDSSKQESFMIGTAIHAAILEPESFAAYYVPAPKFDMRTNAGKAEYAAFKADNNGKIVIPDDDYKLITMARNSALAHPTFQKIYEMDHICEASIFWDWDSKAGHQVRCKCRPDLMLHKKSVVVDIKTTADIKRFASSVFDYRYHVQDQHYSDGVSKEFGDDCTFYFLAISTSFSGGMLPVHLFELGEEDKELGRRERDANLEAYRWCQENQSWPGVEPLSLPAWAKNK